MSIIQDYKYWKEARKATEIAECKKDMQFNHMLGHVSLPHYGHNVSIQTAFVQSAPDPKTNPQECVEYMDRFSPLCHAYPCFYVMYNPFDHIGVDKVYKEKQVQRCMNNLEDGTVYESFCHGCDAFKDLVKFQSLKAQVQLAKEKQQEAKQKLLSNFIFWKQRAK